MPVTVAHGGFRPCASERRTRCQQEPQVFVGLAITQDMFGGGQKSWQLDQWRNFIGGLVGQERAGFPLGKAQCALSRLIIDKQRSP